MIAAFLAVLSGGVVSYVSVSDESFNFMRTPSVITRSVVTRGDDVRNTALFHALAQPPMPEPVSANLQIPLDGHSANDVRNAYFHNYFTDTADSITVHVRLRTGHTVSIVSNSQMPLMLPWVTYGLHDPTVTYDARLSRAVAALLPKSAPSLALLSGQGDMGWLPSDEAIVDPKQIYVAEGLGGNCLRKYVREHGGVEEHIHLSGDMSLSLREQEQFLADLYHAGEENVIDDVAGQLQVYTWVTLRSDNASADWIVGPNNLGTILWRHSGTPVLGAYKMVGRYMDYNYGPCF